MHGIAPKDLAVEDRDRQEPAGNGVRWTRTLREGEMGGVMLESMGGQPRRRHAEEAQRLAR